MKRIEARRRLRRRNVVVGLALAALAAFIFGTAVVRTLQTKDGPPRHSAAASARA